LARDGLLQCCRSASGRDRAVSALIGDLIARGLFDHVLIVMAGKFGRTPKVFTFPGVKSNLPGRDHWGAVQSVFVAGGGVKGGTVIGASDTIGGYPIAEPQRPENLAATIYQSLGLPPTIDLAGSTRPASSDLPRRPDSGIDVIAFERLANRTRRRQSRPRLDRGTHTPGRRPRTSRRAASAADSRGTRRPRDP
jgi:hypothetical protein